MHDVEKDFWIANQKRLKYVADSEGHLHTYICLVLRERKAHFNQHLQRKKVKEPVAKDMGKIDDAV